MSFYDPKISPALPFSSQVFLAKSIRLCYDQINDLGYKFRRLFFWLFRLRKQTDPGSTSLGSKTLRHRHRGAQNLRGTAHRSGRDLQRLLLPLFRLQEAFVFSVLEGIHTEIYDLIRKTLAENATLPPDERVVKTLLAACKQLSDTGSMRFIENDAEFLPGGFRRK